MPSVFSRVLVAGCLLIGLFCMCGRTIAEPPAQPPSAPPVFDIPNLEGLTIDGRADDWADHGFKVDVFYPRSNIVLPHANFHPRARFAWDKDGLLVLVRVDDDVAVESPDKAPWEYDSVELFVACGPQLQQQVQLVISPGRDTKATGGKPAANVIDRRADQGVPLKPQVTSSSDAAGYQIEVRLPWSALSVSPKDGETVAANVQINDRDRRTGGRRYETAWYTTGWSGAGPQFMHRLRLASSAGAPDRIVAGSKLGPAYRDQQVLALAQRELAGQRVNVTIDGKPVGDGTLQVQGDYAQARIDVPIPSVETGVLHGAVTCGDRLLHVFDVQNNSDRLMQAVTRERLQMNPVFTGEELPDVRFENPAWIEVLLGGYTMNTVYYNTAGEPVTAAEQPGRYGAITTIEKPGLRPIHLYTTLYRAEGDEPIDFDKLRVQAMAWPEHLGIDPAVLEAQGAPIGDMLGEELSHVMRHEAVGAILLAGLRETKADAGPMTLRDDPFARDAQWWLALRKKLGLFHHRYHTDLPAGYGDAANRGKKWPLILFLHGSGERGYDEEPVHPHGPPMEIRKGMRLPFIVVSPQCEPGRWWTPQQVIDLLDEVAGKYAIDADRVYLTGLSMGGYGSWFTAEAYPERFAAVAPICGGGKVSQADKLVGLPIWVFHGDADPTVPMRQSVDMVNAIKAAGGTHAALTIYPGVSHNSWTATYHNPKLYEWFLANKRGQPVVMPEAKDVNPASGR